MSLAFQRSPKASTLLREPLLRGSAQQVSVRMAPRRRAEHKSAEWRSFLHRSTDKLRALPREVWVVLLIDFLNSYRSFGFRSVQYQYMVNEFRLSDVLIETNRTKRGPSGRRVGRILLSSFGGHHSIPCHDAIFAGWPVRTT